MVEGFETLHVIGREREILVQGNTIRIGYTDKGSLNKSIKADPSYKPFIKKLTPYNDTDPKKEPPEVLDRIDNIITLIETQAKEG